jgi:hypothetical protein
MLAIPRCICLHSDVPYSDVLNYCNSGVKYVVKITFSFYNSFYKEYNFSKATHFYLSWRNSPTRTKAASFLRFLDHTQLHTTVVMTPLDEGSARRRDLYLPVHNSHKRHASMPPAGFEPSTPVSDGLQTLALDRSATGTGMDSNPQSQQAIDGRPSP